MELNGIITYISNSRNKTSSKIRIGSKQWALYRFINLNEKPLSSFIGATAILNGEWKLSKSFGRIFYASNFKIVSPVQRSVLIHKVTNLLKKNNIALPDAHMSALSSILVTLFALGRKSLLLKFVGWSQKKQFKYVANPYLFFLNNHLDFYSSEIIASMKPTPPDTQYKIQALMVKILSDAYAEQSESMSYGDFKQRLQCFICEQITDTFLHDLINKTSKVVMDHNAFLSLDWIFYIKKKAIERLRANSEFECDSINDKTMKDILKYRWSVLAGSAGTGKTTILQQIQRISGMNILYCASTGKAAQLFQCDAATVHALLGYRKGKFSVDKLDCDLLVVDEASMLSWHTIYAITKAAPRAIFAGDPDQLPPVQGEPAFKDLMKILPVVKLEKVWRFSSSNINDRLKYIEKYNESEIITTVKEIAFNLQKKGINFAVLSPVKSGLLGTDYLNKSLQRTLNNKSREVAGGFRIRDKIVVTQNVYIDGEIIAANGETGYVKDIQFGYIAVRFHDRTVLLEENDINLAYALTIHKAQGSEYDYVILVIPPYVSNDFLSDELINVGISRGKVQTYILHTNARGSHQVAASCNSIF